MPTLSLAKVQPAHDWQQDRHQGEENQAHGRPDSGRMEFQQVEPPLGVLDFHVVGLRDLRLRFRVPHDEMKQKGKSKN